MAHTCTHTPAPGPILNILCQNRGVPSLCAALLDALRYLIVQNLWRDYIDTHKGTDTRHKT